jgi:hypothetical protein
MSTNVLGVVLFATAMTANAETPKCVVPSNKCILKLVETYQEPRDLQGGEIAEFNAEVRNISEDTVQIVLARGDCSCTKVEIQPSILEPGQLGKLHLTIDSRGKTTAIRPFPIHVKTKSQGVIKIEGNMEIRVNRNILIDPPSIELGNVVQGQRIESTLRVRSDQPFDKDKISVVASSSDVHVNIPAVPHSGSTLPASPGTQYQDVTLNASVQVIGTEGKLQEEVHLIIRDFLGCDRTFQIPISGYIVPVVRAVPERLFLGYIKAPAQITKEITIKHEMGKKIEIAAVNCPQGATITYKEKEVSASERRIEICMNIKETKGHVGTIPIVFEVMCGPTVHKITVPCVYVSSSNEK